MSSLWGNDVRKAQHEELSTEQLLHPLQSIKAMKDKEELRTVTNGRKQRPHGILGWMLGQKTGVSGNHGEICINSIT
jgi:hypothetical protein